MSPDLRTRSGPPTLDVSFVVVSWNGVHLLPDCLSSIATTAQQAGVSWELIVVDNGSTDGSRDLLARDYPDARVIANSENRGFAGPNNQAFEVARGAVLALVNNDIVLDPGWLTAARTALAGDAVAGVATQIRFQHDRALLNSTGIQIDRHGVASDRNDGESVEQGAERGPVFGPCAGAALLRREAVLRLGGFDEDFFAYYEDVDLSWRARRAGYRFVYEPDAVCYHAYSQTSGRMPGTKEYLLARNRWVVIFSNIGWWHLRTVLPSLVLRELILIVAGIVKNRQRATLRGRAAGVRRVRSARAARGQLPYLPPEAFEPAPSMRHLIRRRLQRDRSGLAGHPTV